MFMWSLLLELISATGRSTDGWHGQTWLGWREFRIDRAAGSRLWDGIHDEDEKRRLRERGMFFESVLKKVHLMETIRTVQSRASNFLNGVEIRPATYLITYGQQHI